VSGGGRLVCERWRFVLSAAERAVFAAHPPFYCCPFLRSHCISLLHTLPAYAVTTGALLQPLEQRRSTTTATPVRANELVAVWAACLFDVAACSLARHPLTHLPNPTNSLQPGLHSWEAGPKWSSSGARASECQCSTFMSASGVRLLQYTRSCASSNSARTHPHQQTHCPALTHILQNRYPYASKPDQDDIVVISATLPLVPDEAGNTPATAVSLPTNSTYSGTIRTSSDVDTFSFVSGVGTVALSFYVVPSFSWYQSSSYWTTDRWNLGAAADLMHADGTLLYTFTGAYGLYGTYQYDVSSSVSVECWLEPGLEQALGSNPCRCDKSMATSQFRLPNQHHTQMQPPRARTTWPSGALVKRTSTPATAAWASTHSK